MWIDTQWDDLGTVAYYRPEQHWYEEYKTLFELDGSKIDDQSGDRQKQFVTWKYPKYINFWDNVSITTPKLTNPPVWKCSFCFEIVDHTIVRVSFSTKYNAGNVVTQTQDWVEEVRRRW